MGGQSKDDSAVIFEGAGTEKQRSVKIIDPAADHFMEGVLHFFRYVGRFAPVKVRNTPTIVPEPIYGTHLGPLTKKSLGKPTQVQFNTLASTLALTSICSMKVLIVWGSMGWRSSILGF